MQSCDTPRYAYSASTQNVPQITRKGDYILGGNIASGFGNSSGKPSGLNGFSRGSDLHAAYALTNHFAIMVNSFHRREEKININLDQDTLHLFYKRNLTEFAVGYLFSQKDVYSRTHFQIFAGLAKGKFKIDETLNTSVFVSTRFHHSNITKLFIQPAVTLSPGRFQAIFSSRFNAVYYRNISTDYDRLQLEDYLLKNLAISPVFFWEPAMGNSYNILKHGGLKIELQLGLVVLMNRRFVDYRTMNGALGIKINNNLFAGKKLKVKNVNGVSP